MKFAEHLGAHITPEWRKQCKFHNLWFHEFTNLRNCKIGNQLFVNNISIHLTRLEIFDFSKLSVTGYTENF